MREKMDSEQHGSFAVLFNVSITFKSDVYRVFNQIRLILKLIATNQSFITFQAVFIIFFFLQIPPFILLLLFFCNEKK